MCVMLEDPSMLASGFTLMPHSDKDPFVPTAAVEEHARGGTVHGRSETFECKKKPLASVLVDGNIWNLTDDVQATCESRGRLLDVNCVALE